MSPARRRKNEGDRRTGEQRTTPPRRRSDRWRQRVDRAAILAGLACVVLGWLSLQNQASRVTGVVGQIQTERGRNTRNLCLRDNSKNLAIRNFITASIPPSRRHEPQVVAYLKRAETSFPTQNCTVVQHQQVNGSKP